MPLIISASEIIKNISGIIYTYSKCLSKEYPAKGYINESKNYTYCIEQFCVGYFYNF
jgi:hypothetical protein